MADITTTNTCQLCGSVDHLISYTISPAGHADNQLVLCPVCISELAKKEPDGRYWRFLTEAMWSETPAVQVLAWRLLTRLSHEDWASACLDQFYLEEETLAWARSGLENDTPETTALHKDSLGQTLQTGDTVVLTRTLDVKGSALSAKMGTVVKNIHLVEDNANQIEGKIDGQTIVILTKYLRKQKK